MKQAAESSLLDPGHLSKIEDYALLARVVVDGALNGIHRSLRQGRGTEFSNTVPTKGGGFEGGGLESVRQAQRIGGQDFSGRYEFQRLSGNRRKRLNGILGERAACSNRAMLRCWLPASPIWLTVKVTGLVFLHTGMKFVNGCVPLPGAGT